MNLKNIGICFLVIFIFVIIDVSSIVSAYVDSSYSPRYNRAAGLGGFSGGSSLKIDESMCSQGTDFVVQLSPLNCEPAVVTSDLLAEENVNVFCKLTGYKMNPLIDVSAIDAISFNKEYPREVLSIGYMPAQAALGYVQTNPAEGINLAGSLFLDNLGYVVITLRRQPNESALTNCKKSILGTQICYVSGNLTATLRYDVENAFGVGKAVFYLPEITDADWKKDYVKYSFWEGRGYLRARAVDDTSATLSLYSDDSVATGVLSGHRNYELAEYRSNLHLDVGETSDKIFLPGLSPCLGNLKLELLDVENPDTVVQLRVNEQFMEVKEHERFLDNKCTVENIFKSGIKQEVRISCREDSGTNKYLFTISPKVDLEITNENGNKEVKSFEVGDFLYEYGDAGGKKNVYLGYIGTYSDSSTIKNPEDLFIYLVALPDVKRDKLSESEVVSVSNYVNNIVAKSGKFLSTSTFLEALKSATLESSVTLGNYLIKGEEFKVIPYLDSSSQTPGLSYTFKGRDVALIGFSITGNEDTLDEGEEYSGYYFDAMNDFEKDVNTYPNERESENSIQTFGERALMEEIKLAESVGQRKTMLDLCKKFVQDYPNSYESVDFCTNLIKLSNTGITEHDVVINNEVKRISFDAINEPSLSDYSVNIVVGGENKEEVYTLRKNTPLQLKGFKNIDEKIIEDITLEELEVDKAVIKFNLAGCENTNSQEKTSETFSKTFVPGGSSDNLCGYRFRVTDINLKKVAKVSIIPGIDFAKSSSNFSFKVGVEKRAIQLSPEKAKEKIVKLNKTIGTVQKISNYLKGMEKTMRTACVVTEGVLLFKNFIANKDGTSIARQEVMTQEGGWNDKCKTEIEIDSNKYKSLNDCFLKNSDKIEKDVDTMASANKIVSGMTRNKDYNDYGFMKEYSEKVDSTLEDLSKQLSPEELKDLDLATLKQALNSDTTESLVKDVVYNVDNLNEIQTYALYLLNGSSSGEIKEMAFNKLKSEIAEVTVNSERYLQISNSAEGLRINPSHVELIGSKEDDKRIYQGDTLGSINLQLPNLPSTTPVGIVQFDKAVYVLILDTLTGMSKNYPVKKTSQTIADEFGKESFSDVYWIYTPDGAYVRDESIINQLKGLHFQVVDASDYNNLYLSSYGEREPLVYYFDTPYQNLPAVVPLDLKEGWYVGVENPSTSYDASGVIRQFWICNVGSDGIESFQVSNPLFGGDNCHLVVLGEMQTAGSVPQELINKAVRTITSVSRQYKAGIIKVNIGELVTNSKYPSKTVNVGKPVSQTSSRECTDYWPVEDCIALFNVCDPVVCPSSRCNLGGKYFVKNVPQSGIIGSIALCYPNAKWEGGDVYIPVCLSGISAGVEGLLSVLQANADCLQKNVETGELVGICDYKNSIFLCQLAWEQAIPIIKYFSSGIIDKIDANRASKGGGEYMSFSSALKNLDASTDYFKQYYFANSYRGEGGSETEEIIEGTVCGSYASFVVGDLGSLIDNLISPDSPYQFIGKFEETQLTTATNPPTSKYKVWYHIYAGTETGAYYTVNLKSSGTSYYQDTAMERRVASGYIEKGGYADESVDFTAPSGYSKLCINVNGHEECGFKEVSSSFAVNYLSDLYLKDQAENTNITTKEDCISGTPSLYSLIDLSPTSITDNLANPELYSQGIVRTCSTENPGAGVNEENWRKIGICGDKNIGCWISIESVENAINSLDLEEQALGEISNFSNNYLSSNYLTDAQFESAKKEIESETNFTKKTIYITSIINSGNVFYNYQKAYLYLQRGISYGQLAIKSYQSYATKKTEEQKILSQPCEDSILGERIFINAKKEIGTDTTRFESGKAVYDNVCATFVSNVLIKSGGLPTLSLSSTSDRDAIVELVPFFKKGNYSEIDRQYWKTGLKPGDIIIWGCKGLSDCSNKPDADEYQHITIFSKYSGSGIESIHDPGTSGPVAYRTYSDPFGTSWYITHVWRASCVKGTSGTTSGSGSGTTIPVVSGEDEIFLIAEKQYLGLKQRNVYFKYQNGKWKWAINSIYKWEDTSSTVTINEDGNPESPKKSTLQVIQSLNALKSNIFENGKVIIKYAGGTTMNGLEIITNSSYIPGVPVSTIDLTKVFLIREKKLISSSERNIYFYYENNKWKWSMESLDNWESTGGTEVTSGKYAGESPEKAIREVIEKLNVLSSNSFEQGKIIIKSAGGTDINGLEILSNIQIVYVVEPSSIQKILGRKTVYYICVNEEWKWSMDGKVWMSSSEREVTSGQYQGKGISNENEDILEQLEQYEFTKNSIDACKEGISFLLNNSAVMQDGSQIISSSSNTSSCTDTCASKGYECGTQTICSKSVNCGTCTGTGQTCNSSGKCVSCTDTCASKGYECGTQTICSKSVNCGTCTVTGQTCNSSGKCVTSSSSNPTPPTTLTAIRQRVLDSAQRLNGTIVPKGENTDCATAVNHIYEDASVSLSNCIYSAKTGQEYTIILSDGTSVKAVMGSQKNIDGDIIWVTANSCTYTSDSLSYPDVLKSILPGDRLDIVYDEDDPHGVIFINWVQGQEYKIANIFDWNGRYLRENEQDKSGKTCTPVDFHYTGSRCKVYQYKEYDLSVNKHPVYRIWHPV